MKVFLIAFGCEPERPSEPGIGWAVVGELASRVDLTVLTRCNNRDCIEDYLRLHPDDVHNKISFRYFDLPEWFHRLKKKLPCGIQIYHELWQFRAARHFAKEMRSYDIVHQLIFGGVFFTPWASRNSPRFVWGPVGGALGAMEPEFLKAESRGAYLSEWLYAKVSSYSYHPLPFVRKIRSKARAILFRTSELMRRLPHDERQLVAVVPESAYAGEIVNKAYRNEKHSLRFVSIGRLTSLKGVGYAIKAYARYLQLGGTGEYHLFGDGELKGRLTALVDQIVPDNGKVVFHGNRPHPEVLKFLCECDVLLHGSFREGASWTILEGMAHGLPVICQHRAGMIDMVPADCGVRIVAQNPEELVEQMAQAMFEYYQDPQKIKMCGLNGVVRVRDFYTWKMIGDKIEDVYKSIMGGETSARR